FYVPSSALSAEFVKVNGAVNDYEYYLPLEMFAANRYGRALAGAIRPRIKSKKNQEEILLGQLIFLPRQREIEQRERIKLILEDLLGVPQSYSPPEWISDLSVPSVHNKKEEISANRLAIAELEAKNYNIQRQIDSLNEYRKLVYATGADLEEIFSQCLTE